MWNYQSLILLKKSPQARRMLWHLSWGGAVFASLQFGEVIARKSLGASALQVTLLTMMMPIMNLTSIYWGWYLVGRDQRRLIWVTGIAGCAALLSGVFLETFIHLYIIFFFYFINFAVLGTARNRALQQHIPSEHTGGLFGFSLGVRMVIAAVLSLAFGWWLDVHPTGWKEMLVFTAVAAYFTMSTLASMRTFNTDERTPLSGNNWILAPWKKVIVLLKRRPDYLRFEIAFMLYGVAFMMMLPVVPIYLVDDLQLGYGAIGLAKGAVFQVAIIMVSPLFGKLFDKSTPHKMSAWCFLMAAAYPLIMMSAQYFEGVVRLGLVTASFFVFGMAMSGISVLWNLASMRFSGKDEDAGLYQSVHQAATGIRGLFAPLFGYIVMHYVGMNAAFLTAAGFWCIAAMAMVAARYWDERTGTATSLRVEKEI